MPFEKGKSGNKKTQFKPGKTGNPKGRPKKLPELEEIMANGLGDEKNGITAAQAIVMAQVAKAVKGDTRAAEWLFDRGYGKVLQGVDMTSKGEKINTGPTVVKIVRDNGKRSRG